MQKLLTSLYQEIGIISRPFLLELDPTERRKLVEEFNNPDSKLRVMIYNYQYLPAGYNLQRVCYLVHTFKPVQNMTQYEQAISRVIRIDQEHVVTVIDYITIATFNNKVILRAISRGLPGMAASINRDELVDQYNHTNSKGEAKRIRTFISFVTINNKLIHDSWPDYSKRIADARSRSKPVIPLIPAMIAMFVQGGHRGETIDILSS
jgi:hypothetical protein